MAKSGSSNSAGASSGQISALSFSISRVQSPNAGFVPSTLESSCGTHGQSESSSASLGSLYKGQKLRLRVTLLAGNEACRSVSTKIDLKDGSGGVTLLRTDDDSAFDIDAHQRVVYTLEHDVQELGVHQLYCSAKYNGGTDNECKLVRQEFKLCSANPLTVKTRIRELHGYDPHILLEATVLNTTSHEAIRLDRVSLVSTRSPNAVGFDVAQKWSVRAMQLERSEWSSPEVPYYPGNIGVLDPGSSHAVLFRIVPKTDGELAMERSKSEGTSQLIGDDAERDDKDDSVSAEFTSEGHSLQRLNNASSGETGTSQQHNSPHRLQQQQQPTSAPNVLGKKVQLEWTLPSGEKGELSTQQIGRGSSGLLGRADGGLDARVDDFPLTVTAETPFEFWVGVWNRSSRSATMELAARAHDSGEIACDGAARDESLGSLDPGGFVRARVRAVPLRAGLGRLPAVAIEERSTGRVHCWSVPAQQVMIVGG